MAEVLGTIASAIQVADLAKKLKDFCDDVKDAPEAIKHLVRQVHNLSTQCVDVAAQVNSNPIASAETTSLELCLRLCELSAASLKPIVQDLESLVSRHRTLGSLKAALKKNALDGYRSRLQDTCNSLNMAHSIFTENIRRREESAHVQMLLAEHYMRQQENHTIQEALSNHHQTQGQHNQTMLSMITSTNARLASLETNFSTLTISSTGPSSTSGHYRFEGGHRYKNMSEVPLDLRLATWWLGHVFVRSLQGWKARLGFYPRLSGEEPQFRACGRGNVDELKELFLTGKASPFDRSRDNWSFLHYSFYHSELIEENKRAPLALFMLDQGADTEAVDSKGWSVMDVFVNWHLGHRQPRKLDYTMLTVFRRILEQSDIDCEEFYVKTKLTEIWYPEFFVVLRQLLWPPIPQRSLEARLELAFARITYRNNAEGLTPFIRNVGNARIEMKHIRHKLSYFVLLMELFGTAIAMGKHETSAQLHNLLKDAVRSGFDISQSCKMLQPPVEATALGAFLHGYLKAVRKDWGSPYWDRPIGSYYYVSPCTTPLGDILQSALEIWVEKLATTRIDLNHYGQRESEAFSQWYPNSHSPSALFSMQYEKPVDGKYIWHDVDYFEYGPKSTDWKIHVSGKFPGKAVIKRTPLVADQTKQESQMEEKQIAIPGSWVGAAKNKVYVSICKPPETAL